MNELPMNEENSSEQPKRRGPKPRNQNQEESLEFYQLNQPRDERIWVSLGTTINTGNYENQKIDIGITGVPVGASQEYIDNLMARAIVSSQQVVLALAQEMGRILREEYGR